MDVPSTFEPARVYFERAALEFPLGRRLLERFRAEGVPISYTTSHNQVRGLPGDTPRRAYAEAKRTLVVGVRRRLDFPSCRPSAHFQLPLVTSCPAHCEYCYLQTTLGPRPYVRVYVNLEEILAQADARIAERGQEITRFEGAATSDPVPVEKFTGALATVIEHFARSQWGRFRFVTKFVEIDPLLPLNHRSHTEIRFSVNAARAAADFEKGVPKVALRLMAARRVADAGYPLGFLVAPVFIDDGWQNEYRQLLDRMAAAMTGIEGLGFEIITHRYTSRARNLISERFPETRLPMNDPEREFKFGQFGYGKYLYPRQFREEVEGFFRTEIPRRFHGGKVLYVV